MKAHCDLKGNVRDSVNLSEKELKGMRQVIEGIESKGWYLYQTDKCGRMHLDKVRNYIHCIQEHVNKDQPLTANRIREAEDLLNNHART